MKHSNPTFSGNINLENIKAFSYLYCLRKPSYAFFSEHYRTNSKLYPNIFLTTWEVKFQWIQKMLINILKK